MMGPGRRFFLPLVLILTVVAKRGVCPNVDWTVSTTGQSASTAEFETGQSANTLVPTTGQSANTAMTTAGQSASTAVSTIAEFANAAEEKKLRIRKKRYEIPVPDLVGVGPSVQTVNEGDFVQLRCFGESLSLGGDWDARPTVTWSKADGPLPPTAIIAGPDILIIFEARPEHAGTYRCSVAGSGQFEFQLTVQYRPIISAQRKQQTAALGSPLSLSCEAQGTPQPTIKWIKKDGDLSVDHSILENGGLLILYIPRVTEEDEGSYECQASNSLGTTTRPVVLTIGEQECPENRQWRCGNGRCIFLQWLCNGRNDCGDNTDEKGCGTGKDCPQPTWKCDNKRCISFEHVCDGVDQCGDDETKCQDFKCPEERPHRCQNGACIYTAWLCNGQDNCGDGSDETYCRDFLCPKDRSFKCDNGACIADGRACNGRNDCGDNSDENKCTGASCPENSWQCDNGKCVSAALVCDGWNSCGDNSDENKCQNVTCPEDRPWKCDNGKCIYTGQLCDDYNHCGDGSDERNCPHLYCTKGKFRCSKGHCIPSAKTCDDHDDCGDMSDEDSCSETIRDWGPWVWSTDSWGSFKAKCPPSERRLREETVIKWIGDGNYSYCTWQVLADSQFGVVVLVRDIQLQPGLNRLTDDVLRVHFDGRLQTFYGDSLDDPVVIADRGPVRSELVSYKHSGVEKSDNVSVSVAYTPYPRHTLPPALAAGVYNCSSPYSVPPELQCDGFVQCLQAEDELNYNCNYTRVGCQEGWIAAGSLCLKFVFPPTSVSPDAARQECADRYQAELGSLPQPRTRRLAASLLVSKGHDKLITGLERARVSTPGLRHLYRFLWQWPQAGTEFDGPRTDNSTYSLDCSILNSEQQILPVPCNASIRSGFVCSRLNMEQTPHAKRENLTLEPPTTTQFRQSLKPCDAGHLVHWFHPCSQDTVTDISAAQLPLMSCRNARRIHYTLICDGYDDCQDGSDEINCHSVEEGPLKSSFTCMRQAERVDNKLRCNGVPDCLDASDEDKCDSCSKGAIECGGLGCMPCGTSLCPSFVDNATVSVSGGTGPDYRRVDIDEYGVVTVHPVSDSWGCPEIYFMCEGRTTKTCIPSFLVGNGQHDCPMTAGFNASADEPLEELKCPGHYRCYQRAICIHPTYFCDGVYHCPLKDDERYCNLPCPQHCTCEGLAYTCSQMFDPAGHLHVRYLNLNGTLQPPLDSLHYMGYLSFLSLSRCDLKKVDHKQLTHLRVLDLSYNTLSTLEVQDTVYPALEVLKLLACHLQSLTLRNLHRVLQLDISGNRLKELVLGRSNVSVLEVLDISSNELASVSLHGLRNLTRLDLSNNNLTVIMLNNTILPALQFLNLSYCKLNRVSLVGLDRLQVLDLSSNNLTTLVHITLTGLHALAHLNLSQNLLLPHLDVNFQTFLQEAGNITLQSLFLSNTGIQSVKVDPFIGSSCCPHLDITENDISSVDRNMFTAWTSRLSLLETRSVNVCCAYYYAFPNTTITCQTPTEIVFPEQCISTALGEKMRYHTAFGMSDQRDAACDVGWLSFQSLCLRFVFPRQSMSARSVKSECRVRFGASLAALPPVTDIATGFLHLSSYQELLVGLEKVSVAARGLKHQYRFLRQWSQGGVEFRVPRVHASRVDDECAVFCADCNSTLQFVPCGDLKKYAYVCSKKTLSQIRHAGYTPDPLPRLSRSVTQFPSRFCSDGSLVHTFHPCRRAVTWPQSFLDHTVLMDCKNGRQVHYTMVCDGHDDCGDGWDEVNCLGVHFDLHEPASFKCTSQPELVDSRYRCNGVPDCHDGSDEDSCGSCSDGMVLCQAYGCVPEEYAESKWLSCDSHVMHSEMSSLDSSTSLIMASIDEHGFLHLNVVSQCPETHFQCKEKLCIPSFLVNNGVPDCPLSPADDEAFTSLSCPGYYRCYQSGVCLHPDYLCDGTYHCPLKDDERYCNFSCPENCTCEGLAYDCSVMFDPVVHRHVRYLDLSGTPHPSLGNLTYMVYLSYLNVSSCNLNKVSLFKLVHLRVLDLSHNQLTTLTSEMLGEMPLLTHFNVSNNPLALSLHIGQFVVLLTAAKMDQLLNLGLQATGIKNIEENAFQNMSSLQHIDLRGNEIEGIKEDMFRGLGDLQILETDDPRLCCPYFYVYPNKTMDCRTPIDELSSCSDLLRSDFIRVCLWTLSVMTIIGNIGVVIYRFVLEPQGTSPGFRILVANLCVADFLMGVYMIIIGAADSHYSGQYIWQQEAWTGSALCQTAGFLALLSSEVSAFMICLVTLDRLLVLCFPFSHHLHLTPRSTTIACGVAWFVGIVLAVVPFLPAEWKFYGQTGLCLPLPITRRPFPGQQYAFSVFVIFNFILFLLIGAGQLVIFRAIRNTPMASRDSRRKQDMAIARRLFLIVFSDFCCWFPIGLMGLLASQGTPIPGEVNVLAAIFILPVNSALNPFLYTLGMVLERWFRKREERRIQRTLAKLHTDLTSWPIDKLLELMHHTERAIRSLDTISSQVSSPQGPSKDTGGSEAQ